MWCNPNTYKNILKNKMLNRKVLQQKAWKMPLFLRSNSSTTSVSYQCLLTTCYAENDLVTMQYVPLSFINSTCSILS